MIRFFIALLVILLNFLVAVPAHAIANPNAITVNSVRVFVGVWEAGDMLFVVEYNVDYVPTPGEPTENPEDAFLVGIWNASDVKGPDRPLTDYEHNVTSVYLTAAQVTSFGYAAPNNLKVRVMGNPLLFGTLTEDVNMDTFVLGPGHWIYGYSLEQTRLYLGDRVIVLAGVLQASWGITLLTSTSKLNAAGKVALEEAIPGLQSVCPDIFQVSASYPTVGYTPGAKTFEGTLGGKTGTRLSTALEDLGEWGTGKTGMGTLVGSLGVSILFFILAGRIFIATGSVPIAIAVSIPFLLAGNLMGVLPLTITFLAAFLVVVMFGITFILGRL